MNSINITKRLSLVLLVLLIALCIAWEWLLAPVRPGGTLLALKALPLMACVWGIARGERRVFQILSLLVWLYVLEGLTRVLGDRGLSAWLSAAEALIAITLFIAVALYAKWTRAEKKVATNA